MARKQRRAMMQNIGRPDVEWLTKLLQIVVFIYAEYPELFTEEDEETLKIVGQLIRSLQ